MKTATEYLQCDFRFSQRDVSSEMLDILKQCWPQAYEEYKRGHVISLCFRLEFSFAEEGALAKLAPFFHLAKGFSINHSTSIGSKPPVAALFEAVNSIGK